MRKIKIQNNPLRNVSFLSLIVEIMTMVIKINIRPSINLPRKDST